MTKGNTTLLITGGLAALVAVAAAVVLRPTPEGETGEPVNFWEKTPDFSVHNGLAFHGYGSLVDRWVNGILPGNPLAPISGGYYGPSLTDKYAGQYTTPPATSSPTDPATAFTPAGGSSGTSGSSFGVGYKR